MAEQWVARIVPVQRRNIEKVRDLRGDAGQNRLEVNRQLAEQVEEGRADLLQFFATRFVLGQGPGRELLDFGVRVIGHQHHLAQGGGEIAGFVQVAQIVGLGCEVLEQRAVMHGYCQMAVVQLLDEASAAAGDVDVFADQIAVDAIREVDEVEIEIVDAAAELGGEEIGRASGWGGGGQYGWSQVVAVNSKKK